MSNSDLVEKSWDLSLYEIHRTPQEVITDENMEIAVSARSLQSELTCPICLGMLTQTMTTKECLHRFCSDCIVTALRSGNKECPTCRKKLASKRSLRPDRNFDALVEKIFPNRDEYEAHQESILESLSRSHSQNFITSITDGIKAQMAHAKAMNRKKNNQDDMPDSPHHTPITGRLHGDSEDDDEDGYGGHTPLQKKKKKKIRPPTSILQNNAEENASDSNASGSGASSEVEIVFKLHPHMMDRKDLTPAIKDNATRYIKTTSKALVDHLCKYLAMRISIDLPTNGVKDETTPSSSVSSNCANSAAVKDLTIFVSSNPGNIVELPGSMTLTQVSEKYWKVNKPMELLYSFQRA